MPHSKIGADTRVRIGAHRWRAVLFIGPALVLALCAERAAAQIRASVFVSGLSAPLAFVQDPSDPSVQFVVEQGGRIRPIRNGVLQSTDFLDLSAATLTEGERGLLGLAFPPDYATSGRFYVNFTNTSGDTVIARFKRSAANPLVADATSRFDLRWGGPSGPAVIAQPFSNHNGGHLAFGPDGFLYIGLGDGGSGGDPGNRAQDPGTLLGKMLRIDVGVPDSDPQGYRIPPGNPFVGGSPVVALPEIWAFGLRNPWRYSFDDPALGGTGALLIADVGQSAWEEISYEPAGRGGRNYGWSIREGAHDYDPSHTAAYLPLTDPIHEYSRAVGTAVTGGFVYRGRGLGSLYRGRYFFADFGSGRVFSLGLSVDANGEAAVTDQTEHTEELGGAGALGAISSIGVDANGDLYIVSWTRGRVLRLIDASAVDWATVLGSGVGPIRFIPGEAAAQWSVTPAALNADTLTDYFLYNATTGEWQQALAEAGGGFVFGLGTFSPGWRVWVGRFRAGPLDDVFVYNPERGGAYHCLTDGSGGFQSFHFQPWSAGWDLHLADLNGDTRADVFVYNRSTGQWYTCLNGDPGLFTYHTETWSPLWTPTVADLDGNGRDDVFVYNEGSGRWYTCLSTGAGTFTYGAGSWSPGWQVRRARLEAGTRDGLFVYNPVNGRWYQCYSDGAGGFRAYVGDVWSPNWSVTIADLNGDALDDVFVYNTDSGDYYQCLTAAGGGFRAYLPGSRSPGATLVVARP